MDPVNLFRQDPDPVHLKAGEPLFRTGDPATDMFVLLEGKADVIVGNTVVETSGQGALLGEMALIDNSPRSADVVAKTECKLARISPKRFNFLVQQTPYFSIHVMKVLVERIRDMDKRVTPR